MGLFDRRKEKATANAEELRQQGQKYYNNNELEKAAQYYRKAAMLGNAKAQNTIGSFYFSGEGVRQDYTEAVKWLRKAADQGLELAQHNLGYCYANGQGVRQDFAEAAKWYQKAAAQGYPGSQNNLGQFYYNGQGVRQDYTEAAKWFQKAADQGNVNAQYQLADLYYKGEGVPKDYHEARKWFQKAFDQGDMEARTRLLEIELTIGQQNMKARKAQEEKQRQAAASEKKPYSKPHINLCLLGITGSGKTSITAAITNAIYGKNCTSLKQLDNAEIEQEKRRTIHTSIVEFETSHRHYALIDVPGHPAHTKNLLNGMAQADAVILVVSDTNSIIDLSQLIFARAMGIKQVVVAFNIHDDSDPQLLDVIEIYIRRVLNENDFDGEDTPICRISPFKVGSFKRLFEVIDEYIPTPAKQNDQPFRMAMPR